MTYMKVSVVGEQQKKHADSRLLERSMREYRILRLLLLIIRKFAPEK